MFVVMTSWQPAVHKTVATSGRVPVDVEKVIHLVVSLQCV